MPENPTFYSAYQCNCPILNVLKNRVAAEKTEKFLDMRVVRQKNGGEIQLISRYDFDEAVLGTIC